jgi:FAD/FMN-containing dehydrogenase
VSAPLPATFGFRGPFLLDPADRSRYAEASGILASLPRAAALPLDADDVVALVRWAAATHTPLVPRGAGTGMPGGNVGGGVAVDLVTEFRSLGPIDPALRRVRAEPGVILAELNRECEPAGLHFPPDPSSAPRATLGGMLANNSAGSHSVKYGATRRWVHALDLVLADGSRARVERGARPHAAAIGALAGRLDALLQPRRAEIETHWPRVRKNSSGYALREYLESGDLEDLLLGSEGTHALEVCAEVDLAPLVPERGLALLEFTSLAAAGDAIQALHPLGPATCEILDRTFLELVRKAGADADYPLREGLEAILLVEMEGNDTGEVRAGLERVEAAVRGRADRVALALDPHEQHRFWAVRHAASPIIAAQAGGRVSMQFIEDCVVPVDRLPDFIRALREILDRNHLPAVIFGHAGDGNLHVNPLVDVHEPGWRDLAEHVLDEVAALVARLGGTLTGEHGDGRLRAPLLETIWGSAMVHLFRSVKEIFDPTGILNPGVILPLPGQRPLDSVRSYR